MVDGSVVLSEDKRNRSEAEDFFDGMFQLKRENGWPDRLFVSSKGVVGVEVKNGSQPMNDSQWHRADDFVAKNWKYIVFRVHTRLTKTAGPTRIFTISEYIGSRCFKGLTAKTLYDLLDKSPPQEEIVVVNSYDLDHGKYAGFLWFSAIGPVYALRKHYRSYQSIDLGDGTLMTRGDSRTERMLD